MLFIKIVHQRNDIGVLSNKEESCLVVPEEVSIYEAKSILKSYKKIFLNKDSVNKLLNDEFNSVNSQEVLDFRTPTGEHREYPQEGTYIAFENEEGEPSSFLIFADNVYITGSNGKTLNTFRSKCSEGTQIELTRDFVRRFWFGHGVHENTAPVPEFQETQFKVDAGFELHSGQVSCSLDSLGLKNWRWDEDSSSFVRAMTD